MASSISCRVPLAKADGVFLDALRIWGGLGSAGADTVQLINALSTLCNPFTNLNHSETLGENLLEHTFDLVQRNVDLAFGRKWRFFEYPDQAYVQDIVCPHYVQVKSEAQPTIFRVSSFIQGRFAVYDKIMLPIQRGPRVAEIVSLSRVAMVVEDPVAPVQGELSGRERQCLWLLASGKAVKQIAAVLDISTKTAEKHIQSLKVKLGARTIAQAVARGMITYGTVFPPDEAAGLIE